MTRPRMYHAYDPPPPVRLDFTDKVSLTRQSEAGATDINKIMAKYEKTGVLPHTNRQQFFADVSTMGDYRTALDNIRTADEAFMELPAQLRARFENDAAIFLDFCSDPTNREEMVNLGLIEDKTGKVPEPSTEPPIEPPEPEPVS